ncbi:MAG: putative Transcriptional regulator, LuxR family protein [Gammaproteobacteria bacterium]|jgi:DNA-binding CsgD family transcriptional regulator|nr:putative Transcriptional regulator, LuxR family protein [Gammaproteobacteria bacterium]
MGRGLPSHRGLTMAHGGNVLDLIAMIYAAAADPALWPVFLERFAEDVSGSTTSLFAYSAEKRSGSVMASARFDPADAHKYNEYYAGIDCWGTHGGHLITPGAVFLGQQLCPDGVLERSEFYADFLRPMHTFHEFCGVIAVDASAAFVIACLRPKERGPFDDSDTLLLKTLMPHLQRALSLQQRIAALEASAASAVDVLDTLPYGVVLISADVKVLLVNRFAQAIIAKNDGLTISGSNLCTRRTADTLSLQRLIHESVATSLGRGLRAGGTMNVLRPSQRRSFHVLVTPLHLRPILPSAQQPAAVAFISDPECQLDTPVQALGHLFALSHAEARLAAVLVKGCSLREAAEELGVSLSTVRTQLKKLFEKTGTKRQSALIRAFLMSPARLLSN